MKFSLATLALLPIAANAAAYSKSEYASGAVHQKLMKLKNDQWESDVAAGKQDPKQWTSWMHGKPGKKDRVECKDGLAKVESANGTVENFRCKNVSRCYVISMR
jgi:hypothetical protein